MLVQDVPVFGVPFFEQSLDCSVPFLVTSQAVIGFGVSFRKVTL